MRRVFGALLLSCAVVDVVCAAVPIFSIPPSAGAPIRNVPSNAVVADYAMAVDVMALAENLVSASPQNFSFHRPDGPPLVFGIRRTSLDAGFEVDERGHLRLVEGAVPEDLTFHIYGVTRGAELSLRVRGGRPIGSVTGMLQRPGQAWDLLESHGRLVLRDVDSFNVPGEPPENFSTSNASPKDSFPDGKRPVDSGGTVDVLVLHTQQALEVAGGQQPLDDFVGGSFAHMTTALANSEAFRVQVNHLMPDGASSLQVAYDESPNIPGVLNRWYAHRRWVRTSALPTALRDQHQADLVVLVVGDTGSCGVAYTQRPNCGTFSDIPEPGCTVGAGYAPFAFAVISAGPDCPLSTYTFAHEVGHQFGLEHDPPNGAPTNQASFPWSYGHTVSTPAVQARTIMAYQTAGACPLNCPIQLHYANPAVNFEGFPGTPTGTFHGAPFAQSRGDARTAVLLAPAMARFRGPIEPSGGIFGHGFEALPDFPCSPAIWPNCPAQ